MNRPSLRCAAVGHPGAGSGSGAVVQAVAGKASPCAEKRITLHANPESVAPGTSVEIEADSGLSVALRADQIPAPGARGYSTVQAHIRARVTVEPGSRLCVLAAAGEHVRAGSVDRPPPRFRLGQGDRSQERGPDHRSRSIPKPVS